MGRDQNALSVHGLWRCARTRRESHANRKGKLSSKVMGKRLQNQVCFLSILSRSCSKKTLDQLLDTAESGRLSNIDQVSTVERRPHSDLQKSPIAKIQQPISAQPRQMDTMTYQSLPPQPTLRHETCPTPRTHSHFSGNPPTNADHVTLASKGEEPSENVDGIAVNSWLSSMFPDQSMLDFLSNSSPSLWQPELDAQLMALQHSIGAGENMTSAVLDMPGESASHTAVRDYIPRKASLSGTPEYPVTQRGMSGRTIGGYSLTVPPLLVDEL